MREGIEDYELLRMLRTIHPVEAERIASLAVSSSLIMFAPSRIPQSNKTY
jgi:hypothetical protein